MALNFVDSSPYSFKYRFSKDSTTGSDGKTVEYDEVIISGKMEFLSNPDGEMNFCEMPEASSPVIVLNFKDVSFVNSLGLNFLLNEYEKCKKKDKKLFFSNVGSYVKKVLNITKLDAVFKIVGQSRDIVNA